jgi:hypothetical protein
MPRYLLGRTVGDVSRQDLDRIAAHSTDQESVLAHAAALGLPVERCLEVEADLAP